MRTELVIFTLLFALVAGLGFYAVRWNSRGPLDRLDEWALGGRRFGFWVSFFLNSGEIFTASTFIALPALMFGVGAVGFYLLPFTIFAYSLAFLPLVRLWSVSRANGYVTPADYVTGRYGSTTLGLLVALTAIIATVPYIAVQLAGLEAVLRTIGLNRGGYIGHAPLFVAFVILAAYTYRSGLRAPALIAFVKAMLIYPVIIAAVIILPLNLGGWDSIFNAAHTKFTHPPTGNDILLGADNQLQYITLALGSALAMFLYPHTLTGVFAARDSQVIKRNLVALPAYSLVLGMFGLLGYAAIAAHTEPLVNAATNKPDSNTLVPMLFQGQFPPLVRRNRLSRHRDRHTGPGLGHVHRCGESVEPQHLQGISPTRRDIRTGDHAVQDRFASGQIRRGSPARATRPAILPRPATHRRSDHPADTAHGSDRALHPLVPPLGTARRLGSWDGLGPMDAPQHPQPHHHHRGTGTGEAIDPGLGTLRGLDHANLSRIPRAGR
jgi:Na+/pantothenate symporter